MNDETKELEVDLKAVTPLTTDTKGLASPNALETGELRGTTLDEQWRLAVAFCKSGMLPKAYQKPEQVLVGMQFAYELGLKPLMALRQIAVINGQPSLWGELPLALVRRSGQLVHFKEWIVDKDYVEISFENKNLDKGIWAAICEIQRKGGEKRTYTFTQNDKHGMGVAAIWAKFEKTMMMRKARSAGLKAEFGDILEGMLIAEYDFHVMGGEGETITVEDPQQKKLKDFGSKFKRPGQEEKIEGEET